MSAYGPQHHTTEDDINEAIDSIPVDKANFEHIAQTGKINGSLRASLRTLLMNWKYVDFEDGFADSPEDL